MTEEHSTALRFARVRRMFIQHYGGVHESLFVEAMGKAKRNYEKWFYGWEVLGDNPVYGMVNRYYAPAVLAAVGKR